MVGDVQKTGGWGLSQLFRRLGAIGLLAAASGCSATDTPDRSLAMQGDASSVNAYAGGDDLQLVSSLPAPANTRNGADQLISAGDVLEFDVFQVDDLNRTLQVDGSGSISLPLIGTVPAAGMSVRSLEADLERRYGADYLQNPDVTLFMKESAGQRVTVDGEVAKTGVYPVAPGASLSQVLAQAGGFRPVADLSKVYVFRDFGKQRVVAQVDMGAVRAGRQRDPEIYGGDTVVVFSSATKVALQNLKEALGLARSGIGVAAIP